MFIESYLEQFNKHAKRRIDLPIAGHPTRHPLDKTNLTS